MLDLRRPELAVLGLLFALVVWTGLALIWTESAEKTFDELSRVIAYLGVFCAALALLRRGESRSTINAVAAAIALIGTLALLSQLQPEFFPADDLAAAQLGGEGRLNYPLNYWNGLATAVGDGVAAAVLARGSIA